MSPDSRRLAATRKRTAPVFAALGDETRLTLISRLCDGRPRSIGELTAGTRITRQAVTKHLRVLERAGIVRSSRSGRHSLFNLEPEPIEHAKTYLGQVSELWDRALQRLQSYVED